MEPDRIPLPAAGEQRLCRGLGTVGNVPSEKESRSIHLPGRAEKAELPLHLAVHSDPHHLEGRDANHLVIVEDADDHDLPVEAEAADPCRLVPMGLEDGQPGDRRLEPCPRLGEDGQPGDRRLEPCPRLGESSQPVFIRHDDRTQRPPVRGHASGGRPPQVDPAIAIGSRGHGDGLPDDERGQVVSACRYAVDLPRHPEAVVAEVGLVPVPPAAGSFKCVGDYGQARVLEAHLPQEGCEQAREMPAVAGKDREVRSIDVVADGLSREFGAVVEMCEDVADEALVVEQAEVQ